MPAEKEYVRNELMPTKRFAGPDTSKMLPDPETFSNNGKLTFYEKLIAIACEELASLCRDGWDCVDYRSGGQGADEEGQHYVFGYKAQQVDLIDSANRKNWSCWTSLRRVESECRGAL